MLRREKRKWAWPVMFMRKPNEHQVGLFGYWSFLGTSVQFCHELAGSWGVTALFLIHILIVFSLLL